MPAAIRLTTALILTLAASSQVAAQSPEVWERFRRGWAYQAMTFYPPERPHFAYGQDPRNYEADLRKVFTSDRELALTVCAAVQFYGDEANTLPMFREPMERVCKDFPPPASLVQSVGGRLRAMSNPRRRAIAQNRRLTADEVGRIMADVYLPPPASANAWAEGAAGRDYAADVTAAFDADPTLAARICDAAETSSEVLINENLAKLRPQLLRVCAAYPVERMVAAHDAKHRDVALAWLHGLQNTYGDEVELMPEELRRAEVDRIAAAIAQQPASVSNFQLAMKAIAMDPGSDWGPALMLTHLRGAGMTLNPGAKPDEVRAFLDELYTKRSRGAEGLRWKRGWRAYLFLSGEFDRARTLADQIASEATAAGDLRSRDSVYLATMEAIAGNHEPYTRLMANCPDPDAAHLQKFGRPATNQRYCEQEVAAIAAQALHFLGDKAPRALHQLFAETNRVKPHDQAQVATLTRSQVPSGLEATATYAAIFNSALDRAEKLSGPMRSMEAETIISQALNFYGDDAIEKALRIIALTPADDRGPWLAMRVLQGMSRPNARITALTTFLTDLYRRRMSAGDGKDDWTRGWRAYLFYSGAFTEALDVSRELMKTSDVEGTPRDRVFLALLERINGNPAPAKALLDDCPPAPPSYTRKYGEQRASTYCRRILWSISYRAVQTFREESAPVLKQTVLETMNRADWQNVFLSVEAIAGADPEMAEQEWYRVLTAPPPDLPEAARTDVFISLRRIAERQNQHRKSIELVDRYLRETGEADPGFRPEAWRELATRPETGMMLGVRYTVDAPLYTMVEAKIESALRLRDLELAKRTLETLLSWTLETGEIGGVRHYLMAIASAMLEAGKLQEPLRILGYLSLHPLGSDDRSRLDRMLERLASGGKPVPKLEPAATPWDSLPRPDLRKAQPQNPGTLPVT